MVSSHPLHASFFQDMLWINYFIFEYPTSTCYKLCSSYNVAHLGSSSHTQKGQISSVILFSILLASSFLKQLTTNGFQVTPILVAWSFSRVLSHTLLKMIFSLIAFFPILYHQFSIPSIRLIGFETGVLAVRKYESHKEAFWKSLSLLWQCPKNMTHSTNVFHQVRTCPLIVCYYI